MFLVPGRSQLRCNCLCVSVYVFICILFRRIPSHAQIFAFLELFFMLGTKFPGQFIVLHCTHGVNRTGFFSALLLMIFGG